MNIGIGFFSLLNACIFLATSGRRNCRNIYLGIIFIFLALSGLTSLDTLKTWPENFRQLILIYVLPIILSYNFSIGPLLYFYVRHEVLEIHFKLKKDFKHLLIFSVSFMNLIPYYMGSYAFKKSITDLIIQNQIAHLKINLSMFNYFYLIGASIHTLFYLTLSFNTLSNKNHSMSKKLSKSSFDLLNNWLYTIIGVFYAFVISNLLFATYPFITGVSFSFSLHIVTGIIFMFLNLHVYKHPQILFGIKFSRSANSFDHINKLKSIIQVDPTFEMKFNQKLDQYRLSKEYLKSEFTIAYMVKELEVPKYILIHYFKNHLKIKFMDFRNELRINYFREKITKEDFERYTLESIANKFGFAKIKNLEIAFDACQDENYEVFYLKLMNL